MKSFQICYTAGEPCHLSEIKYWKLEQSSYRYLMFPPWISHGGRNFPDKQIKPSSWMDSRSLRNSNAYTEINPPPTSKSYEMRHRTSPVRAMYVKSVHTGWSHSPCGLLVTATKSNAEIQNLAMHIKTIINRYRHTCSNTERWIEEDLSHNSRLYWIVMVAQLHDSRISSAQHITYALVSTHWSLFT